MQNRHTLSISLISVLSLLLCCAAAACDMKDDTSLTVEAQTRVNRAVTPTSSVDVAVHDGVAILSGTASSRKVRDDAVVAVQSIGGVRAVKDEIVAPDDTTRTTGATVEGPQGSGARDH